MQILCAMRVHGSISHSSYSAHAFPGSLSLPGRETMSLAAAIPWSYTFIRGIIATLFCFSLGSFFVTNIVGLPIWHYGSPTLSPSSSQLGDHQNLYLFLRRGPKINRTLVKFKNTTFLGWLGSLSWGVYSSMISNRWKFPWALDHRNHINRSLATYKGIGKNASGL